MLLPYSSNRPPRNPPITVVLLVLFQFAVFGAIAIGVNSSKSTIVMARYVDFSLVPGSFKWYAPFTYSFLHSSVFHLSINMLFLWVFGSSLEDALNWKKFLGIYFVSAILTGLLEFGMTMILPGTDRSVPIVGASGAVSAILGLFAVRFYRSKIKFIGLPIQIPSILLLMVVLLSEMGITIYQLATSGFTYTSAHWAHIGGFMLGMFWAQTSRLFAEGKQEYLNADAQEAMKRGSPMSAIRRWETFLMANPNDAKAHSELAIALNAAGEGERSISHSKLAIQQFLKNGLKQDAINSYIQMQSVKGDASLDLKDQFAISSLFEELAQYENSVSAFQKVILKDTVSKEAEMATLRIGVIHMNRLKNVKAAEASLRSFISSYPNSEFRTFATDLLRTSSGSNASQVQSDNQQSNK